MEGRRRWVWHRIKGTARGLNSRERVPPPWRGIGERGTTQGERLYAWAKAQPVQGKGRAQGSLHNKTCASTARKGGGKLRYVGHFQACVWQARFVMTLIWNVMMTFKWWNHNRVASCHDNIWGHHNSSTWNVSASAWCHNRTQRYYISELWILNITSLHCHMEWWCVAQSYKDARPLITLALDIMQSFLEAQKFNA